MRRLVWMVAWVCVAVWSLFCAAAYGVFNLVGGWAARNADAFSSDPQTVEWIWRVFSWIHNLSTGAVLVGWGIVSMLMLAVPWALDRIALTGQVRSSVGRVGPGWTARDREGVIDLGPDQYSVGPGRQPVTGAAPPPPSGPAPRIGGRG